MSIIDDLKRLERLGDENSKTVEKIRSATATIAREILKKLEGIPDDCSLPRGYTVKTLTLKADDVIKRFSRRYLILSRINGKTGKYTYDVILGPYGESRVFLDSDGKEWLLSQTPVDVCLTFAKDLADGFLTELADQVEWHTKKANESLAILENFTE